MSLAHAFKALTTALVICSIAVTIWLYLAPPALLRVGTGYAAKIVCSNVFLASRDPDAVLYDDVQAPGNVLLRLVTVSVDRANKRVTAAFLGFLAPNFALFRGASGCTSVPDGDFAAALNAAPFIEPKALDSSARTWPEGDAVLARSDSNTLHLLDNEALTGPKMRAVIVVHNGQIIAERYGHGFNAKTPLLGWSMTKTVNALLIGRLIYSGKLGISDTNLFRQWQHDDRSKIKLSDLLAMRSGLAFNESYGSVTDATRMLYLEPDMVSLPITAKLVTAPGAHFNYSSGTSVLLSAIWMDRVEDRQKAFDYPTDALFGPLGMTSAVLEQDARGTFAGGTYLYATARDWARLGQFLLQDGVWKGQRLLSEDFMDALKTPQRSGSRYTQAQAWVAAPGGERNADAGVPADTFWLEGHDGQSMAIVPSLNLVLLRMGLTPDHLSYKPQILLKQITDKIAAQTQ
ncbi:serine hydrolase [Rhizobium sp. ZPR3]|uniref:Serine hydrolase n=2 Tax=unclassified Rhizobium TaxID=2613769 RepID=A0AAU7S9E0_9HYPH